VGWARLEILRALKRGTGTKKKGTGKSGAGGVSTEKNGWYGGKLFLAEIVVSVKTFGMGGGCNHTLGKKKETDKKNALFRGKNGGDRAYTP